MRTRYRLFLLQLVGGTIEVVLLAHLPPVSALSFDVELPNDVEGEYSNLVTYLSVLLF